MTDKEVKESAYVEDDVEIDNQGEYYDEIDENIYYHGKNKNDFKHDMRAARFKKKPIHKITVDDEVPEEPKEKRDKPNDSHYEKELAKIQEQIEKHKKNKDDLHEKKRQEKFGKNPKLKECHEELKVIKEALEPIEKQIIDITSKINGPLEEEKRLKVERDRLDKEVDLKDYDKMKWEIEQMQEKLGFGTLTASEEKKIMDKKSRLESQLPKCKKLTEIKKKLKQIKDDNKGPFDERKNLIAKKNEYFERRKTIHHKIDGFKSSETENKVEIEQINIQIESVKEEIKKLNSEYYRVEREWNEKWKKFEEYMEIMDYIRDFKKRQSDLKKKDEKLKKKAEKDAKKEGTTNQEGEIKVVSTGETEESKLCKRLISLFKSIAGIQESKEEKKVEAVTVISDKLSEDLKNGLIQEFNRDDKEQELGIEGKSKKKAKGPKVSKRDQKTLNNDLLVLGVETVSEVKSLGLTVPDKKTQVEAFIKTLESKLEEIQVAQKAEVKSEVKTEKNAEN